MAPPILRRTGWSRKAQYSLFFGFIALIAGLAIGLVLLIISLAAPRTFDQIEGAALDATKPVREATTQVVTTVNGVMGGAGDYWDAIEQNKKLRAEKEVLRRRAITAAATRQENELLKQTLELRESLPETVATGRVIGSTKDSQRQYAILSVGTSDGVQSGMSVQAADGLIGRIVETGFTSSRVLLVTDRSNIVPAKILRSGEPVIATGKGELGIDLRPLEVGRNPFEVGDVIVTSGTGGLYAPLVPVARVVRLDDDGAIAVPLATPALSSFATVQPPYEPDAFDLGEDEDG
ncbi:rod shape-determining protein MreC [Sphingomicrobium clamense]|uniref:Rod shape-determining protein MreC n=1 Tax=Sphingomicrobium clamense TaxID=2851013 RepID=A0ABS6V6V2_9SPHN|nr:rod shape-determining protein MreC [Sphingomicrobium sp. B8]MBW0145276.1 rod shape-determining protein MreC [Sphingomicrobium sp. B8]